MGCRLFHTRHAFFINAKIMHAVWLCTTRVQLSHLYVHAQVHQHLKWISQAGACLQVPVAPAAAFNIDTFGFCKPSIPELLLMMMFLCLSIGNLFVGSATIDVTAYFGFYKVAGFPHTQHCLR